MSGCRTGPSRQRKKEPVHVHTGHESTLTGGPQKSAAQRKNKMLKAEMGQRGRFHPKRATQVPRKAESMGWGKEMTHVSSGELFLFCLFLCFLFHFNFHIPNSNSNLSFKFQSKCNIQIIGINAKYIFSYTYIFILFILFPCLVNGSNYAMRTYYFILGKYYF